MTPTRSNSTMPISRPAVSTGAAGFVPTGCSPLIQGSSFTARATCPPQSSSSQENGCCRSSARTDLGHNGERNLAKRTVAPQETRNTTLSPIFNLLKTKGECGASGGGRLTAERYRKQATHLQEKRSISSCKNIGFDGSICGPWPENQRPFLQRSLPEWPPDPLKGAKRTYSPFIYAVIAAMTGAVHSRSLMHQFAKAVFGIGWEHRTE